MELLIIKAGSDYIRVREGEYLRVGLDKASVFPMDRLPMVRTHESRLKQGGFQAVRIKKLILTEEDLA